MNANLNRHYQFIRHFSFHAFKVRSFEGHYKFVRGPQCASAWYKTIARRQDIMIAMRHLIMFNKFELIFDIGNPTQLLLVYLLPLR